MSLDHRSYWDNFYSGQLVRAVPGQPSAFAHWAKQFCPPESAIWEFGLGTARDSLWFASRGYSVRGFDFAKSAVDRANELASENDLDAQFDMLDLNDNLHLATLVETAQDVLAPFNIYGRFLIHSLTDEARHNFFSIAAQLLTRGGHLLLEFRTDEDAKETHLFGEDHYRKYLDPDSVIAELEACGATVVERVEGRRLAVYKTEDPHVARLVSCWT